VRRRDKDASLKDLRGKAEAVDGLADCKDNFPTQAGGAQDVSTPQVLQRAGGCRAFFEWD